MRLTAIYPIGLMV